MFAAKKELPRKNISGTPSHPNCTPVDSFKEEQPETFTSGFNWPVGIFPTKKAHSKF
jgi:hypothetical protein